MELLPPDARTMDEVIERIERITRANIDEKELMDETEELALAR